MKIFERWELRPQTHKITPPLRISGYAPEWHKRFRKGRTDVEDDERSWRPTISKTINNIREIEKTVREDRRLSIRLIAERMSINKETVWQVLHDNLHMTKVCAQVVSKLLTND